MRLLIGVRGAGLGIGSFKNRAATTAFHYHNSETVLQGGRSKAEGEEGVLQYLCVLWG